MLTVLRILRAVMVLSRVMSMGKHAVTLTYGSYGITIQSHVVVEMTSMVLYNVIHSLNSYQS